MRLRRYYNSARNMDSNPLDAYGPLLLMFIAAMGISGAILVLSVLVGRHRPSRAKDQPYECGIRPTGDAREPFSVQFYLVALVFILFDIEAIFLYPWALVYRCLLYTSQRDANALSVNSSRDVKREPCGARAMRKRGSCYNAKFQWQNESRPGNHESSRGQNCRHVSAILKFLASKGAARRRRRSQS